MNKLLLVAGIALVAGAFFWHSQNQLTSQVVGDFTTKFAQFKQTYNKKYSSAEETFRLAVYTSNMIEA
jgi:hypothetical protein